MKIFVTGGTGFVGRTVIRELLSKGHEVTLLTRKVSKAESICRGIEVIEADPTTPGPWQESLADHDAVINLAGSSIFTRWTKEAKKTIRQSRLDTTRNLVNALSDRRGEDTLLLSTSAVGYYGLHGDEELDENSPPGQDFLATLAKDWEEVAYEAQKFGARVITLRFGIVLGKSGGALEKMIKPFKMGFGARLGSGEQWFSWIHEADLASIYSFLLDKKGVSGPFNCTAPEPVRNKDLTKALAEALKRPLFMPPVPGFLLRAIMGEFGSVLLNGQRVLPKRLLTLGYRFRFSTIRAALEDLLSN